MKKPSKKTPLHEVYETIFKPVRLALAHPKTGYQYELNLRRFDEFLKRPATLADLRDETVSAAVAWMRKEGWAPGSVEKFRDNMVTISRLLFRKRVIETDLEIAPVHVPKGVPVALDRQQLHRLWQYLERLPGDVSGIPANLFFMALMKVFWNTGARKGEVFGLLWQNVDLQRGFIVCKANTVKANKADNLYRIDDHTAALLRQIIMPERALVFPWPWSESILYDRWSQIMQRAGLPSGPRYCFHVLRKSVATHVRAAGGNVQATLRHADPRMAEIYVDETIAPAPSASDFLFRLHEPPKEDGHAA